MSSNPKGIQVGDALYFVNPLAARDPGAVVALPYMVMAIHGEAVAEIARQPRFWRPGLAATVDLAVLKNEGVQLYTFEDMKSEVFKLRAMYAIQREWDDRQPRPLPIPWHFLRALGRFALVEIMHDLGVGEEWCAFADAAFKIPRAEWVDLTPELSWSTISVQEDAKG